MSHPVSSRRFSSYQLRTIGLPTVPAVLTAAMPKCPICWMAWMSVLGLGSATVGAWLQPIAALLLLLSLTALLLRARQRASYGPFILGLGAAVAMFLCKFKFNSDLGVYSADAALIAAVVWNTFPKRSSAEKIHCRC